MLRVNKKCAKSIVKYARSIYNIIKTTGGNTNEYTTAINNRTSRSITCFKVYKKVYRAGKCACKHG